MRQRLGGKRIDRCTCSYHGGRLAVLETIKVSTTMRTHPRRPTLHTTCACVRYVFVFVDVLITRPQAGTPRRHTYVSSVCVCMSGAHISFFTYVTLVRHSVTSIYIYIYANAYMFVCMYV